MGIPLSYASRYAPGLFDKQLYAEPPVFFTHASKSWPHFFVRYPANRFITREVHHQHILKNSTWFFESCHRENSLDASVMLILAADDEYVNGPFTSAYFARFHPTVTVHLMEGWRHGVFWDPRN